MMRKVTNWKPLLAVFGVTWLVMANKVDAFASTVPVNEASAIGASGVQRTVRGKVVDESGNPVSNATVRVKNEATRVGTDSNGEFAIQAASTEAILVIDFLGYRTEEVLATGGYMTIALKVEETSLDEVVVVGYGTQKKVNLTGAVTQVSGKVLEDRPTTNIGLSLQGVVPNLNINTIGDYGGPGNPSSFNVRGTTSINGGVPLFVVDGIPTENINNINPADIESVTVLKDAAAGAIYGSRASYGVILITTKMGSKNDKVTITANTNNSFTTYTALPKMANSLQFAETLNAAARNSGLTLPVGEEQLARIKQYLENPGSIPTTIPMPNDPNIWSIHDANDNVDWLRTYLKPWAHTQKYDLAINGGRETLSYYLGAGVYDQGGQMRYADEKFGRYSLTSNIHAEPTKWLRANLRVRYARENTDIPYHYSNLQGNWMHLAGSRRPFWALRDPNGTFSRISQIMYFTDGGRSYKWNNDLWLTGEIEIEPVTGWKVNANYSFNSVNNTYSDHNAFVYATAIDGSKYNIANTQNSLIRGTAMNDYRSFNAYSSYERSIKQHNFFVLLGHQMEVKDLRSFNAERMDLITDQLPALQTAVGAQYAGDELSDWATMGTFGRITYNYDEKYLFEANARYDGTSRFPKGRRFGFFPSVAVAYNIAKEAFWPLQGQVDYFKLRASYGSLGNQSTVSPFLHLPIYSITPNSNYVFDGDLTTYLGVPGLISPNLTWETVRSLNLGVDATILRNRLDLSFDWYRRTTLDMIGPAYALPTVLGAGVPSINNADLRTTGFELSLNWKDRIGAGFNYRASLVLSDYHAKVLRYNNPLGALSTYYEGMTIGEIWGYETVGIIQNEEQLANMPDQLALFRRWQVGDIEYRDLDGNNVINPGKNTIYEPGDRKVIGNSTPRYAIGANLGFDYKGIDFSMFFQGVLKRDINIMASSFFYGLPNHVWENTLDYWTPENPDAYWPMPYGNNEYNKNRQVQTRYLQDASYMRLKNLQIGYTLPNGWLSRYNINRCRVFFNGENVFTVSRIIDKMDPEMAGAGNYGGGGKVYPLIRSFSFGLNFGF